MSGVLESVALKSASAASVQLASKVFDFVLGEMHKGMCLIELPPETKQPEVFDAICVIAIPLENFKYGVITTKLMHSVVVLVNQAQGIGLMLEYTNENVVKLSKLGRLALKQSPVSGFRPYKHFQNGFQPCSIT